MRLLAIDRWRPVLLLNRRHVRDLITSRQRSSLPRLVCVRLPVVLIPLYPHVHIGPRVLPIRPRRRAFLRQLF